MPVLPLLSLPVSVPSHACACQGGARTLSSPGLAYSWASAPPAALSLTWPLLLQCQDLLSQTSSPLSQNDSCTARSADLLLPPGDSGRRRPDSLPDPAAPSRAERFRVQVSRKWGCRRVPSSPGPPSLSLGPSTTGLAWGLLPVSPAAAMSGHHRASGCCESGLTCHCQGLPPQSPRATTPQFLPLPALAWLPLTSLPFPQNPLSPQPHPPLFTCPVLGTAVSLPCPRSSWPPQPLP